MFLAQAQAQLGLFTGTTLLPQVLRTFVAGSAVTSGA
jgi:hypothetical protein